SLRSNRQPAAKPERFEPLSDHRLRPVTICAKHIHQVQKRGGKSVGYGAWKGRWNGVLRQHRAVGQYGLLLGRRRGKSLERHRFGLVAELRHEQERRGEQSTPADLRPAFPGGKLAIAKRRLRPESVRLLCGAGKHGKWWERRRRI